MLVILEEILLKDVMQARTGHRADQANVRWAGLVKTPFSQ